MNNLFSSFDPMAWGVAVNWLSSLTLVLMCPVLFWLPSCQSHKTWSALTAYLRSEMSAVTQIFSVPGMIFIPLALFLFIGLNNFLGLFPFIFTSSSHPSFTVTLALPLWIGHMLYGSIFSTQHMLARLVPLGTPPALMPFMVLIEMVSNSIRPLTLSVRLAANMIAGHLLMSLLGGQAVGYSISIMVSVSLGLVLLGTLECAVSLIQAYVFSMLSPLYVAEVNSPKF